MIEWVRERGTCSTDIRTDLKGISVLLPKHIQVHRLHNPDLLQIKLTLRTLSL